MADYFTHFSCMFNAGSAENAIKACAIRADLEAERERLDAAPIGFAMQADHLQGPGALWIYSDDNGDPEDVIDFVKRCAEAFDLRGMWGFRWALTCSRPRLDGFGGGAQVIDLTNRTTADWVDCEHWVAEQLSTASSGNSPTAETEKTVSA